MPVLSRAGRCAGDGASTQAKAPEDGIRSSDPVENESFYRIMRIAMLQDQINDLCGADAFFAMHPSHRGAEIRRVERQITEELAKLKELESMHA